MGLGDRSRVYEAGLQHLNGRSALRYARIREIDGDFQRTHRQRKVINILLEKLKKMTPAQLHELLSTTLPYLTTDMTNDEITKYALSLIPMVGELKVQNFRVPADGTYYHANKGTAEKPKSVIVVDLEANREELRKLLGDEAVADD